jgi:tetratricopeptide (TPR) repeat protein
MRPEITADSATGTMRYFLAFLFLLHATPQNLERANHASAVAIVTQIQRADHEGDRGALRRLYEELVPFADDKATGSRVHYWRGFALWRRAFDGFNEAADQNELEQDLTLALTEFEKATDGPDSADAKSAAASCLQNLAFIYYTRKDRIKAQELHDRSLPLLKEAEAAEPENPRVLWVLGASRWYSPPEREGGQALAIAIYKKGLLAARNHKTSANDPLKPTWGEPELLMNLAWSKAHASTPDLKAAEQYANSALQLVPYWHYVRDILLPQIRAAKPKQP